MSRVELKQWAKEKIKGHIWEILIPIVIAGILSNLTIPKVVNDNGTMKVTVGLSLSIFFYFIQVGLAYFMVRFVKDEKYEFKDLFRFTNDYVRIFIVNILQGIFVFLWSLLLVIPGIIKAFAYSLVPLLLSDDKYKDLSYTELLKKSEEIMNGHKMDFFMLILSYIGWHFVAIFTLGLLEIWIIPYETTATYRFLNDVKEAYEKQNGLSTNEEATVPEKKDSFCPNCGSKIPDGSQNCPNCG